MTESPKKLEDVTEIKLPDGSVAFIIDDPDEVQAIREMARDRIWLKETTKRLRRMSLLIGGLFATIAFFTSQWPWIVSLLKLLVKDSP